MKVTDKLIIEFLNKTFIKLSKGNLMLLTDDYHLAFVRGGVIEVINTHFNTTFIFKEKETLLTQWYKKLK
jgi:hypothetical protein